MAKTKACRECSWRKVKCVMDEGAPCQECAKRKAVCEQRGPASATPCDTCKKAHLGCERPDLEMSCLYCARMNVPCTTSADSASPPPPPSRAPYFDVVLNTP